MSGVVAWYILLALSVAALLRPMPPHVYLPCLAAVVCSGLLFVSVSERDRVSSILERLEHAGVMTVSDVENFAASGGMAEFVLVEPYIRFRLNRSVAEASGLTISAHLLRSAIP